MAAKPSFLRDLVAALVLAKLLAVVAGAIHLARGAPAGAPELLGHGIALLLVAGLLRLRGWQLPSPWTGSRRPRRPAAAWLLLAVPLGLLLRWGSSGWYLLAASVLDGADAAAELRSVTTGNAAIPTPIEWLALVAGAVEEEFVYRAMLLGGLALTLRWPLALLLGSAAFGLVHANPVAFIGGLGLGLLYLLSRSLWACALAHLLANLAYPLLGWLGVGALPARTEAGLAMAASAAMGLLAFFAWASWQLSRAGGMAAPPPTRR